MIVPCQQRESRRQWLLNAMNKEAQRIGGATNYKLWRDDNHAVYIDKRKIRILEGCMVKII